MKGHFDSLKRLNRLSILILVLILIPVFPLAAQEKQYGAPQAPGKSLIQEPPKEIPEEALSTTHHSINVNGKNLHYTATAGYLPMKDEAGRSKANIFFVAYVKDDEDKSKRPITFAYNGGPGASSTWLHLGALGPKRAPLKMYTHLPSLEKLSREVAEFFKKAVP